MVNLCLRPRRYCTCLPGQDVGVSFLRTPQKHTNKMWLSLWFPLQSKGYPPCILETNPGATASTAPPPALRRPGRRWCPKSAPWPRSRKPRHAIGSTDRPIDRSTRSAAPWGVVGRMARASVEKFTWVSVPPTLHAIPLHGRAHFGDKGDVPKHTNSETFLLNINLRSQSTLATSSPLSAFGCNLVVR